MSQLCLACGRRNVRCGHDASPTLRESGDPPSFQQAAAAKIDERYELRMGEEPFTAVVQRGRLEIRSGAPDDPAATLHADPAGLLDVRFGRLDVGTAIEKGLLQFDGPDASIRRLRRAFAL